MKRNFVIVLTSISYLRIRHIPVLLANCVKKSSEDFTISFEIYYCTLYYSLFNLFHYKAICKTLSKFFLFIKNLSYYVHV